MKRMSDSSVIKIPKFDGQRKNFAKWQNQMSALLAVKKVQACVGKDFHLQLPASESTVLDESDAAEKKQIVAREKMALCMSYMTLAMDSSKLQKMIESSKSNEWPNGRPDILMAKLIKKYKPSDSVAVAEQTKSLFELKLGKNQDPEELGDLIAELETSFGCELAEKEKVAAVMKATQGRYADTILQETKRAGSAGEDVTVDNLIEVMSERFRLTHGDQQWNRSDDDDRGKEVSLSSTSGTFSGRCNRCRKFTGYMAKDCPCKDKSGGSDIVCRLCKIRGHIERNCWEDEKNASKRPKNWKSRLSDDDKETEANGADIEIMLSSVNVDAVQEDVRNVSAVEVDVSDAVRDERTEVSDAVRDERTEVNDAVRDERTEVSYAVRDERTEVKIDDAIRDVCTDAVHDGRTEMIAVRDERTVYADRDDRTEEMMKNAVRDGRTEKSAHDVYGTDGTVLKSVSSTMGSTTETAFVMNYDSIDSDTDDDERTYDLGSNWAKTSTMVNLEQGGVLDGVIFGARSFTGMSLGATTEHESDVSRTEVEENSHDTTTVINSQIY